MWLVNRLPTTCRQFNLFTIPNNIIIFIPFVFIVVSVLVVVALGWGICRKTPYCWLICCGTTKSPHRETCHGSAALCSSSSYIWGNAPLYSTWTGCPIQSKLHFKTFLPSDWQVKQEKGCHKPGGKFVPRKDKWSLIWKPVWAIFKWTN